MQVNSIHCARRYRSDQCRLWRVGKIDVLLRNMTCAHVAIMNISSYRPGHMSVRRYIWWKVVANRQATIFTCMVTSGKLIVSWMVHQCNSAPAGTYFAGIVAPCRVFTVGSLLALLTGGVLDLSWRVDQRERTIGQTWFPVVTYAYRICHARSDNKGSGARIIGRWHGDRNVHDRFAAR